MTNDNQWHPQDAPLLDMAQMEEQYRDFVQQSDSRSINLGDWMPPLQKRVRPLYPGELCFILADTGVGKSAICQNLALAVYPQIVFLFELELPATLCYERFMAISSGQPSHEIERTYKLNRRVSVLDTPKENVLTCDTGSLQVWQIEKIIEYQRNIGNDPELIIVDYIGLLADTDAKSRHERLTNLAQGLKRLAKSANVVVVATSQIHRKGNDYASEVTIHDARDSGAIEESGGVVIGVWKDPDDETKRRMFLKVLKATKDGSSEPIPCTFDGPSMRIRPEVDDFAGHNPSEDGL
jgi:replicative DNA helicase